MTTLTERESERLRICTETVLEGLQKSFDAGLALIEVRDHKLYREKHSSFKEFCEEVFKISRQRAYQLIEATEIKESLPAKAAKHIVNEAQARALADVPAEDRAKVVAEAAKTGSVTAGSIIEAAGEMSTAVDASQPVKTSNASTVPVKKAKEEPVFDDTGLPVLPDLVALWRRGEEVRQMLSVLSKLRNELRHIQENKDMLWREVIFSGAIADLSRLYSNLERGKPYAVCPTCQGRGAARCLCCKGRGLVSKYLWDTSITKEEKMLRQKQVEKLATA